MTWWELISDLHPAGSLRMAPVPVCLMLCGDGSSAAHDNRPGDGASPWWSMFVLAASSSSTAIVAEIEELQILYMFLLSLQLQV